MRRIELNRPHPRKVPESGKNLSSRIIFSHPGDQADGKTEGQKMPDKIEGRPTQTPSRRKEIEKNFTEAEYRLMHSWIREVGNSLKIFKNYSTGPNKIQIPQAAIPGILPEGDMNPKEERGTA